MKLSFKHLLVSAVLLGALALLYVQSNRVVFVEHEKFERTLRRLQQLDATLNEDVLKARVGLLDDYDSFPYQIMELKQLIGDLAAIPSFVRGAGHQAIRRVVDGLTTLAAQKEDLLERFKSQNAVLNNSLRYLPVAGAELMPRLLADSDARELEPFLNELMEGTLAYSLRSSDEQKTAVKASLEKVAGWRARHPGNPHGLTLASLTAHAHCILDRKSKVEAITRELVYVPTRARTEELLRRYEAQFTTAVRTAGLCRVALYLLCGLLILGIGYTIYALDTANAHLECRVGERTRDLSEKNGQLQAEVVERQRAEDRLLHAHEQLERRVEERTGELKKANTDLSAEIASREEAQQELDVTHKQLLETSRLAGMAEVATSVLHNVGNVLNSVNVSASLVAAKVKQSRGANLAKVVAMLHEQQSDLGAFMTGDPRGRQIPIYLGRLSEHLAAEQAGLMREAAALQQNVGHIRNIVAMQQNYAKASGVTEIVKPAEIVEDALRMNAEALTRHQVRVVRAFEDAPAITVEKHKVLQILVNLVRNARHACDASGRGDKLVTLRVTSAEEWVRIIIEDNGVGIALENLTRIFSHGFTTKKDGHGFGLHSGALAAREMGGSLSVHSDGPGQGATFTIELPLEPPRKFDPLDSAVGI